jgi:class 3 adenylate cyclase
MAARSGCTIRAMEPRIQYAKTTDGVNVAFFALGKGQPLVLMPIPPVSHIGAAVSVPSVSAWFEGLAGMSRLVVYDGRGSGLSDREVPEYSIDTQILDLEAVVAHIGAERFAILAHFDSVPVAIAYASRRPERLTHLVLWCGYASGAEQTSIPEFEAMIALLDKDFDVFTQVAATLLMTPSPADEVARLTECVRASATPTAYRNALHAFAKFDVAELLPRLAVPTLVMDRQGSSNIELSRKLASNINGAELCLMDTAGLGAWAGDIPQVVQAIERFIVPASTARAEPDFGTIVRTVLFTDIVGHTEMMSRLGDERGRDVLREHERITRELLNQNGGTEVKSLGDGFMASFSSVTKAVECAIALQRAFDPSGAPNEPAEPIRIRVGLNAGEPIEEDGDLFGAAVILASRIAAKADGGEILVADTVRGLCSGKGFLFADRGAFLAKGFEEPVRVFEVSWRHTTAS